MGEVPLKQLFDTTLQSALLRGSRDEVAELCGVSVSTIDRWVAGSTQPSPFFIQHLVNKLDKFEREWWIPNDG